MPALLVTFVLLGLLLLLLARRRRTATGLPEGRVIYFDTEDLQPSEQPLYDPLTNLVGRPDYIIRRSDGLIPVEVKSGRTPHRPHPSHVLQLATYCLLIQAVYGDRPPYGIVKYADRAFAIDFDQVVENHLLDIMAEMRRVEDLEPDRSHAIAARCRACGYRSVCDQRLI